MKGAGFLKNAETLLTRVVQPPGSWSMGHLGHGGDLTEVLKKELAAQKRRMGQLEKSF
ncbi:MAG TPA: hypothetical protein VN461_08820 [Vicinamibacteria bacterium]|nr:hypothetical protein [Vicinamibacteria bacterium]